MAYFKKEAYTGSNLGMRYRVWKEEDQFLAATYPEPDCYEACDEGKRTVAGFPFTEEGRGQVIGWLNQQYEERKPEWDQAARR